MVNILLKNNLILIKEQEAIINFKSKIEEMRAPVESDEDIPDELLDPIMGTLIENPVLLPNTDTFIDYDVITNHLLTSSDNPFTRDPFLKLNWKSIMLARKFKNVLVSSNNDYVIKNNSGDNFLHLFCREKIPKCI